MGIANRGRGDRLVAPASFHRATALRSRRAQLAYVLDCLKLMERRGVKTVEVRPEVQQAYNEAIQRRLQGTVWLSGCKSWYLDAHGRNTTLWPGFTFEYRWRTRRFDAASYELSPVRVPSGAVSSVVG